MFLPLLKYFSWDPFLKQFIGSNKSNRKYFQYVAAIIDLRPEPALGRALELPLACGLGDVRVCRVCGL